MQLWLLLSLMVLAGFVGAGCSVSEAASGGSGGGSSGSSGVWGKAFALLGRWGGCWAIAEKERVLHLS